MDAIQVLRGFTPSASAGDDLRAASMGYLVPQRPFVGKVHSVFGGACNIAVEGCLLTVAAANAGNGPTVVRLRPEHPSDLRTLFRSGAAVTCRGGCLRSPRTTVTLTGADVWKKPGRLPRIPPAATAGRLRFAERLLARRRREIPSRFDRIAAAAIDALCHATRELDAAQATATLVRLVGLGEGLTPAGDDFLVGWLAALDALACADQQLRFLRATRSRLDTLADRTTEIAAHHLRLAAGGHYSEDVARLLEALLCGPRDDSLRCVVERVLAVGASSGADTLTGLLAGLATWLGAGSGES